MKTWQGWIGGMIGAVVTLAASAVLAAQAPLKVIYIDVEGAAATLYVTPQGHSLLIDTGWPAGRGGRPGKPGDPPALTSAQRIVAEAKKAGVTKLDYLLISHFHVDHVGGAPELIGLMPVDTFLDHGPNREMGNPNATPAQQANSTVALYAKYTAAIAGRKHRVLAPGDTLKIDDLVFTVVNADRKISPDPVKGGGGKGSDCDSVTHKEADGGEENPRAIGMVGQYGRARILALADTTWDVEEKLVCPVNLIGKVDLMLADNHGTELSNPPQLIDSVRPTVVVFDNGATKGADGATLQHYSAEAGPNGVWQLHFATRTPDANVNPAMIVNQEGVPDASGSLIATVDKSGAVTMTNGVNGFSRTYPKAK